MPLAVSRTVPVSRLQSRIGHTTYRLNTVLVGLDCVSKGQGDGGAIAVTWSPPKTPKLAAEVANQARIFACAGALALAADVFDSFLREFATEAWLGFNSETQDVATKRKTRVGGSEYSVAERAQALCDELELNEPVKIAALELLTKWRNVVVHNSERRTRVTAEGRATLREAAPMFREKYSHFDIELALKNFDKRKTPLPKEVTSLIAVTTNLSREIDSAAIKRAASTSDGVTEAAELMLKTYFQPSEERPLSPWQEINNSWHGEVARRESILKKWLSQLGITEAKTPISAPLPLSFVSEIASLSIDEFARRYDITH